MSEIKLLPCPFCGGEATFSDSIEDRFAEVHCIKCGVKINVKGYPALSKAIKQWNQRKPMERILKRFRQMEELDLVAHIKGSLEESLTNGYVLGIKKAIEICKEEGGIE